MRAKKKGSGWRRDQKVEVVILLFVRCKNLHDPEKISVYIRRQQVAGGSRRPMSLRRIRTDVSELAVNKKLTRLEIRDSRLL